MLAVLSAALAAVAVPPAPPPAPIISVSQQGQATTLSFDVTVRQEGNVLWQGRLLAASNGMASFTQRQEQTVSCQRGEGRSSVGRLSTGLQLLINPLPYGEPAQIRVSAKLERTTDAWQRQPSCDDLGTRSVEVQSTVRLEGNKPVNLVGDAGLSVTLTPTR